LSVSSPIQWSNDILLFDRICSDEYTENRIVVCVPATQNVIVDIFVWNDRQSYSVPYNISNFLLSRGNYEKCMMGVLVIAGYQYVL